MKMLEMPILNNKTYEDSRSTDTEIFLDKNNNYITWLCSYVFKSRGENISLCDVLTVSNENSLISKSDKNKTYLMFL